MWLTYVRNRSRIFNEHLWVGCMPPRGTSAEPKKIYNAVQELGAGRHVSNVRRTSFPPYGRLCAVRLAVAGRTRGDALKAFAPKCSQLVKWLQPQMASAPNGFSPKWLQPQMA